MWTVRSAPPVLLVPPVRRLPRVDRLPGVRLLPGPRRARRRHHVDAQHAEPLGHVGPALVGVAGLTAPPAAVAPHDVVVEDGELDGLALVLPHRLLRLGSASSSRVAPDRTPSGGPHQPRHLREVEVAAVGQVGQRPGQHPALPDPEPDGQPDQGEEAGHHREEVGQREEPSVGEERRAVPGRVEADRDDVPDQGREPAQPPPVRADHDAGPDADRRGEQRVGEGAEDAADDEDRGRRPEAARAQTHLAGVGAGEVEDVLGEREADADEPGVDQPVEDAVDHVPSQPQQQQDEGALGGLLGDGRDDDRRPHHPATGDAVVDDLEDQRGGGRHQRPPAEGHGQQPAGFGLVAVQPQVAQHQRSDRQQGEQEADPDRLGLAAGDEDVGDDARPDQQRQHDQHREDGAAGAAAAEDRGRDRRETARVGRRWAGVVAADGQSCGGRCSSTPQVTQAAYPATTSPNRESGSS